MSIGKTTPSSDNIIGSYLVPKDAQLLRLIMRKTSKNSQAKLSEIHTLTSARCGAMSIAILSALHVAAYGIRAIGHFAVTVISWDDWEPLAWEDAKSALQCAALSIVACGLLVAAVAASFFCQGDRVLMLYNVQQAQPGKHKKLELFLHKAKKEIEQLKKFDLEKETEHAEKVHALESLLKKCQKALADYSKELKDQTDINAILTNEIQEYKLEMQRLKKQCEYTSQLCIDFNSNLALTTQIIKKVERYYEDKIYNLEQKLKDNGINTEMRERN